MFHQDKPKQRRFNKSHSLKTLPTLKILLLNAKHMKKKNLSTLIMITCKSELVLPDYVPISIPDNNIYKDILDPNHILPRIAGKCFRFDCLSQPHHGCFSPHKAQKRQTGQDQTVRVTKTVIKGIKTVSW